MRTLPFAAFVAALTLSFLLPSRSLAEPAPPPPISSSLVPPLSSGEKPVGAAVSPMRKDQRAPFTGVLFSPAAVATIIAFYQTAPQNTQIEVDRAVGQCRARAEKDASDVAASAEYERAAREARLKTLQAENEQLRSVVVELEKKDSVRWSPTTWVSLGVGGGVLLTLGVVYLTSQATR